MRVKQAVILVGGKGTRLGSLTSATPKPLLEIASGLRFLDLIINELARYGFTDILLSAGHLGGQVEETYHGARIRGATISVRREPAPQGTGGALGFVEDALEPQFLMMNGDSFFDINLRALAIPLEPNMTARIALRQVQDLSRYGAVDLDAGLVTSFREKNPDVTGTGLINAGVYFLDKSILADIEGPCSIETDIFPELVKRRAVEGTKFDGYFVDMGLPGTYEQAKQDAPAFLSRPCAFLDRDGVLNTDLGYTHKTEDLEWVEGAVETVRLLNDAGYMTIVVSNQAGMARGYYTRENVDRFHATMNDALAEAGAWIQAYYYCPFHADGIVAEYTIDNHPDRKPNPGMILRACADWSIDKERSFIIGDRESDMEAGRRAGISAYHFKGGRLDDFLRSRIPDI